MKNGLLVVEVVPLNPPPRRHRFVIEHHHDGRINLLLTGVAQGQATRATIIAILKAALAKIEDGDGV